MHSSHLKKTPPSYNDWLRMNGVIGRCENAEVILEEKLAVVNYLFENHRQAGAFLRKYLPEDPPILVDSFTLRPAVLINMKLHRKLQTAYKNYLEQHFQPHAEAELLRQLDQVRACITRCDDPETRKSLTRLSSLAAAKPGDWDSDEAIPAYLQSLENFLALNQDSLSPGEIAVLLKMKGILEHLRDDDQNAVATHFLLDGRKPGESAPELPRFFPDEKGQSATDEIYINAGGEDAHYTVSKIWKIGYDQNGKEAKDNVHPNRYFYTSYNAGNGAPWAAEPFLDPRTKKMTSGVCWTACTHEILPIPGDQPLTQRVRASIEQILEAERELVKHPLPSRRERSTSHHEAWRKKLREPLSRRLPPPFSARGLPQAAENCTVTSLKAVHDALSSQLSEEHWLYVKSIEKDPLPALREKETGLLASLNFIRRAREMRTKLKKATKKSAPVTPNSPGRVIVETRTDLLLPEIKGQSFFGKQKEKISTAKSPLTFPGIHKASVPKKKLKR